MSKRFEQTDSKQAQEKCSMSVIREMHIKPIPTHLLEWEKEKILTILSASKDVEQLELSYIAGENAKLYSHSERLLANVL